ncbi:DUF1329 domain-containing protein [Flagellatimonas centrodinii]|uniref:DUF1329 domain-containing protein n=1 Tax=Flagellatimonas centrodinii TaxID=2806210 RepID=UPI001FFD5309|nr:DUF1329 domain-containing protein [Flagellatimonas centrodinii]ULQ46523.1 DUF1329 domain-containing protein [Flagellatimonas centrodinii]
MHIRRFDRDFSRRHFLKTVAAGAGGAGVLMPLWQALAETGEATRAYPEELLSIEAYTRGRIQPGDVITADNVELVKDLLEPVKYEQVKTMGRRLKVKASTTDLMRLSPWEYLEATLRNQGKARFDDKGNVVAPDGGPWIGGNPFPAAQSALELFASLTLNWGRHDGSFYAIFEQDLGPEGKVNYEYEAGWAELSPVARVSMEPKPYWPGHEDKLRYQSIVFLEPHSSRGTSFLNIWPYDHSTFPVLYGYVPEFKRVRQFPTDQRFEPLIPGSTLYLSDAWAAGDPLYTWGNYRIVGRGPALCALSDNWNADNDNWHHGTHGGPEGKTFWDTTVELVPEAIICEAEPVKFPRAPVSKKRVWFDARTGLPVAMVSYDRRGQAYRSFDAAFSLYEQGDKRFLDGKHPYWSWAHVHAFDLQTRSMTRLEQVRTASGHDTIANDPGMYDRYLTQSALSRLGS